VWTLNAKFLAEHDCLEHLFLGKIFPENVGVSCLENLSFLIPVAERHSIIEIKAWFLLSDFMLIWLGLSFKVVCVFMAH
jgi:hypothetical protein